MRPVSSRLPGAAETQIRVAMLGRPGVAIGGARTHEVAAARAAAHDAPGGIFVVLVGDPLPHVAAEVERAISARARRVAAHGHGPPRVLAGARSLALEVAPVRARAVELAAPGVLASVGAARRFLP